jgi:hypothetical protein
MPRASGTFTVEMKPQAGDAPLAGGTPLARMSLAKVFSGDMAGTGLGEMLTAVTPVAGSAGYVAIERFSGSVHGRHGSFVLQHSGLMNRNARELAIRVVPDSGTDELKGLAGRFLLTIEGGTHHYVLEYEVPP